MESYGGVNGGSDMLSSFPHARWISLDLSNTDFQRRFLSLKLADKKQEAPVLKVEIIEGTDQAQGGQEATHLVHH